jgi:hypothetical protein
MAFFTRCLFGLALIGSEVFSIACPLNLAKPRERFTIIETQKKILVSDQDRAGRPVGVVTLREGRWRAAFLLEYEAWGNLGRRMRENFRQNPRPTEEIFQHFRSNFDEEGFRKHFGGPKFIKITADLKSIVFRYPNQYLIFSMETLEVIDNIKLVQVADPSTNLELQYVTDEYLKHFYKEKSPTHLRE